MALHLKSTKSFKILIGFSALFISGMAATFSVTGIATLFSGYFLTVAFMMGALEFGKIVVASFLARYWNVLSRALRTYFIITTIILILITSAGIFGYLSDAYQKTKGDYTLVEKQVSILEAKKSAFLERKERLQNDRQLEFNTKRSNQTRADSLTSRNQSITRTREDIRESDAKIAALEKQISGIEDSVASYDLKIIEVEAQNIKGELGPLKYIAGIFNTDMDTVVKYFIFLLIFVFDPLAVILFVSLNTIIRKEHGIYVEDELQSNKTDVPRMKNTIVKLKDDIKKKLDSNVKIKEELPGLDGIEHDESVETDMSMRKNEEEEFVNELIQNFEHQTDVPRIEEENKDEHQFYHDEVAEKNRSTEQIHIDKKSSNYHPTK